VIIIFGGHHDYYIDKWNICKNNNVYMKQCIDKEKKLKNKIIDALLLDCLV